MNLHAILRIMHRGLLSAQALLVSLQALLFSLQLLLALFVSLQLLLVPCVLLQLLLALLAILLVSVIAYQFHQIYPPLCFMCVRVPALWR